jgi:hypothetical protein
MTRHLWVITFSSSLMGYAVGRFIETTIAPLAVALLKVVAS